MRSTQTKKKRNTVREMAESSTPEEMLSSDESSGELRADIPDHNLILYVTEARVLRVEFTNCQSWPHETSWTCTPTQNLSLNKEFCPQLGKLKERWESRGEHLTSIHSGSLIFVFGHDTEFKAIQMVARHLEIKKAILLFLHEIGSQVEDINMKPVVQKAKRTARRTAKGTAKRTARRTTKGTAKRTARRTTKGTAKRTARRRAKRQRQQKESGPINTGLDGHSTAILSNASGIQNVQEMHQGNIHISGDVFYVNCVGGTHETSWHCNPAPNRQVPRESIRRFSRRIRELFRARLTRLARGCLIFSFAYTTSEDAIDMIVKHRKVKKVFLDFMQELDPSIEDIRIEVVLRELSVSEEQTTQITGKQKKTGKSGIMASTTEEDGAFEANFPDNKLTLYLAQDGGHVLRVTFHDTSSWCHEITWICTLIPGKYSPYFNSEFPKQLSALKEQFATHGRLASIQIDQWMFVFGHDTEDTASDMLRGYPSLKKIILKFLHDIDAHVTDITMKSQVKKVDAAAVKRDQGLETAPGGTTDHDIPCTDKHDVDDDASHSHPQKKEGSTTYTGMTGNSRAEHSFAAGQANIGNTNINITLYLGESSGKAACRTSWKTTNDIPQMTFIDFESLATLLEKMFNAFLVLVRSGCMVFCFEHESKEDATNMIIRHAEVKEVILHFLQELDPSIQDIRMKVEFRELCQPEEQTADTSETRPRGMADPEHKDEQGTSPSHPQQKDETSHLHIQETGDNRSSLAHSPQKKKKYEDTCLPHPQKTEEDKTSLQQTDEDTSHLQPQEVYVKEKFKYQPIGIEKDRYLFFASEAGNLEEVKRLLTTLGVNVNYRGEGSRTPVMAAVVRGHRDVVKLLVNKGADVSLVDKDGNNILHYACMEGDVETVKCVLSRNMVDINSRGQRSRTPVMLAAGWGNGELVELLVNEGADVSLVDDEGYNILHLACMIGHLETPEFVLSQNVVDIDARDKRGQTAADIARRKGHHRLLDLLVSRGAQ
ncbi:uncharacterized protein LOC124128465 isoform X2 [Haliotis rufescens]|uniref:uncharacterized protein LOC124128465 isoform X2 n=1 Tax=Haliotis rufescens TaxID=6454 RepID=UPI00201E7C3A|nr:uncharacterized protein LOC124128465 isoform X2 [Haliotis rufescens]